MAGHALEIKNGLSAKILKFIRSSLSDLHSRNFATELWDGTGWAPERNQFQRFTWKINKPDVLAALARSSNLEVALGEAYIRGDFDIIGDIEDVFPIGDIEAVFPLVDYLINKNWNAAEKLQGISMLASLSGREIGQTGKIEGPLLGQPHPNRATKKQ